MKLEVYCFLRWFNFEKVVEALVAKKTYHMDLDQLQTVIRQVCRIDDQDEMAAMLNFYHDLGVIVKHGHTVVLQAQWLIDLFKKLITVRPFNEAVSKVLCATDPLFFYTWIVQVGWRHPTSHLVKTDTGVYNRKTCFIHTTHDSVFNFFY